MSKALLDLQIENNQLKERLDRGQYDVDSKMLTLEHDLIEMQVERDALRDRQGLLEADLKEAATELRDLQEEYITLRTNYINLTQVGGSLLCGLCFSVRIRLSRVPTASFCVSVCASIRASVCVCVVHARTPP